ncbi:52 kDa repressor of the inhibitor of the protein kinase-like [Ooceraea biroi]|uniref:52 kDa repressor of the inhibitor of the protein kinase-like n=1 Tax=Ooceraea biroi TaxID=2015173 RepID=UPI000F073469|nr:52 kDa repressor of the inhibitor of the protein kinase-like [Ooceraea biroi]
MLVYCCIQGCKSTTYKPTKQKKENKNQLQFFGFPTNTILKKKWIEALLASGQNEQHVAQIKQYCRICNLHFARGCIEKQGFSHPRLKPNSVPTIFYNTPTTSVADRENIEPAIFLNAPTARY